MFLRLTTVTNNVSTTSVLANSVAPPFGVVEVDKVVSYGGMGAEFGL